MDFLTVHELSREFDIPARVVRYRLSAYLKRGKLHEGEDYRHEDFKDERHFVWKVNPLTFMRLTNLKPKTLPLTPLPIVNEPSTRVDEPANHSHPSVNDIPNAPGGVDNSADDRSQKPVHREMIDLLKDQLRVKDGQLKEQAEQYRQINDLNVKLMGATLQQSQKIEELLRLASNESQDQKNNLVDQTPSVVDERVNESVGNVNKTGSADPTTP